MVQIVDHNYSTVGPAQYHTLGASTIKRDIPLSGTVYTGICGIRTAHAHIYLARTCRVQVAAYTCVSGLLKPLRALAFPHRAWESS